MDFKVQEECGLPISTYFAGVKLRWILDNVPDVRKVYEEGNLAFGTVDSWILWNLLGGLNGGRHITDATNASRSMLMNIRTLKYDERLIKFFGLEKLNLPEIVSSSEVYGRIGVGHFSGVPSPAVSVTSLPLLLASSVSRPVKPKTHMVPAASFSTTPVRSLSSLRTVF